MNENQNEYIPELEKEDEIDLIALAKSVWAGRKTIFICLAIGTVLGVFVAVFSQKEYTVTTVMVPQVGGKTQTGGLSSLAALAGIDLGSTMQTGDMSPLIYPQIVNSTPFKLELMNARYNFEDISQPVSFYEYYTNPKYEKTNVLAIIKKYTIGLPGVIIKAIKGKKLERTYGKGTTQKLVKLNKDQDDIAKVLEKNVQLDVDAKQGYLTLTVKMSEALLSAQVAQKAQELLQREIIRFKVQKAKADLEFIQGRYDELKAKAEGYQVGIAQRSDQYKSLTSAVPQVQTTRMQTQYGIASSVFQEIAKQLEQAKIQVKRDTPVFTIVEPVTVPTEKTNPNRPMILIIWMFLGGIAGLGIVFGKSKLINVKKKWNEEAGSGEAAVSSKQ